MALATRCPHCQTTFRVAHDQLKLRAGLVRCGACKQIFNGIEHLLRPDEAVRPAAPVPRSEPVVVEPEPAASPEPDETDPAEESATSAPVPAPEARAEDETAYPPVSEANITETAEADLPAAASTEMIERDASDDPLQRMTLVDFTYDDELASTNPLPTRPSAEPTADAPDPLEQAIADLQSKPLRGASKSGRKKTARRDRSKPAAPEEPSFVRTGRRRQRFGRAMRRFMGVGSALLLIALLAQSAYVFRKDIAARFPEAKPRLAQACAVLGCQVGLPAHIEEVSIESSELQALAPEQNRFGLTVLLRNHGATVQAWPNIELTLNDHNEKPVLRRVFEPADYLGSTPEPAGFAAKSEQSFRLFFELTEVKASGYRVYLFYP